MEVNALYGYALQLLDVLRRWSLFFLADTPSNSTGISFSGSNDNDYDGVKSIGQMRSEIEELRREIKFLREEVERTSCTKEMELLKLANLHANAVKEWIGWIPYPFEKEEERLNRFWWNAMWTLVLVGCLACILRVTLWCFFILRTRWRLHKSAASLRAQCPHYTRNRIYTQASIIRSRRSRVRVATFLCTVSIIAVLGTLIASKKFRVILEFVFGIGRSDAAWMTSIFALYDPMESVLISIVGAKRWEGFVQLKVQQYIGDAVISLAFVLLAFAAALASRNGTPGEGGNAAPPPLNAMDYEYRWQAAQEREREASSPRTFQSPPSQEVIKATPLPSLRDGLSPSPPREEVIDLSRRSVPRLSDESVASPLSTPTHTPYQSSPSHQKRRNRYVRTPFGVSSKSRETTPYFKESTAYKLDYDGDDEEIHESRPDKSKRKSNSGSDGNSKSPGAAYESEEETDAAAS